jgi:hypothetical protein
MAKDNGTNFLGEEDRSGGHRYQKSASPGLKLKTVDKLKR